MFTSSEEDPYLEHKLDIFNNTEDFVEIYRHKGLIVRKKYDPLVQYRTTMKLKWMVHH